MLRERLDAENYRKLARIRNTKLHRFIVRYIQLCNPSTVFICKDSAEDLRYIRETALRNKEEAPLAIKGHTVHFDNYYDQARDKDSTRFLVPKDVDLGPEINSMNREEGLREIGAILSGIMAGRELYVKFFTLGPTNSKFTVPCLQLTDSSYVVHSENLLYRHGYDEFIRLGDYGRFLKFVHSQGSLMEAGLGLRVSKNLDKRRVHIDLHDETIYSANTQYGGNTIGLKKLAMRLTINSASREGWLTEHMFIMGIHGPRRRVSYFAGAFPSMCGKTATAMVAGETIVGDDIAYLKKIGGQIRAVNAEKGVFGIIEGIDSADEPLIWKALHSRNEIIFSNVLVTEDGEIYWNGKDSACPARGVNYSGEWFPGKKDKEGEEVPPSHKNARFTFDLRILDNVDPNLDNPDGVAISGIIYGGRDSSTWLPVEEAFDWTHGIVTKGASLESETTAATLGKEGVQAFNPMANLDFLSIPIGKYVESNLNFGASLNKPPRIFSVNYFLRDSTGRFLNHKQDKRVWLKWMELRVNDEADAIRTPTGLIPTYEDLRELFHSTLKSGYAEGDYVRQFTVRIPENLAKIERLVRIYKERVVDTPPAVFEVLEEQRRRLTETAARYGDYVAPHRLARVR